MIVLSGSMAKINLSLISRHFYNISARLERLMLSLRSERSERISGS